MLNRIDQLLIAMVEHEEKDADAGFAPDGFFSTSQIRGLIQYYQCCTWVNIAMKKCSRRLQMVGMARLKQYKGKWIPANQTQKASSTVFSIALMVSRRLSLKLVPKLTTINSFSPMPSALRGSSREASPVSGGVCPSSGGTCSSPEPEGVWP